MKLNSLENKSEILAFIKSIYPNHGWTSDKYDWQFLENPSGTATIFGARDGEKLVSIYASIPHILYRKGNTLKAQMVQDVMTAPTHRGRGLLHQLAEENKAWMESLGLVGFTFPNEHSAKSFERTGWKPAMTVPRREMTSIENRIISKPVESRFVDRFDSTAMDIFEEADLPSGVFRDLDYLNWRYARKPSTNYLKFIFENNAYLVLKPFNDGVCKTLHLLDLVVVKEKAEELIPLILNQVRNFAASNEYTKVTAWLPSDHPYAAAFDASGFPLDPTSSRIVYTLDHQGPMNLSQGDSDVY